MDLINEKCVPCKVGAPILKGKKLKEFLGLVSGWEVYDKETKLKKEFEFKNFKEAIRFVNKVADIAEKLGHHPNIYIYNYKKVRVELWTHKISGLHKNDFILAAKIDDISA
jgi:4a-hydroxytetrahydrobiopterin dehydratase